jgi:hypothetical protein
MYINWRQGSVTATILLLVFYLFCRYFAFFLFSYFLFG